MPDLAPHSTNCRAAELRALLLAWDAGDGAAGHGLWSHLQRRLAPRALRLAQHGSPLGLEAEDFLQEAALRLALHRARLAAAPQWNLVAYLQQAMTNVLFDRARSSVGSAAVDEEWAEVYPCPRTVEPLAAAVGGDLRERVAEHLADLGPRLARAVWNAHGLELPWKRVARDGGWAGGDSARVAVSRTFGVLRRRLASFEGLGA
jgi:DNA-directed RNA polymerase specialized sigma24 family protein